jgi:hypothetical protein
VRRSSAWSTAAATSNWSSSGPRQRPGAVITLRRERCASSDHADWLDSTEANDAKEPIENADAAQPRLPIERKDPTEPIENAEPVDAIEQNEFFDQRLKPVRATSAAHRVVGELPAEALVVTRPEVR